MEASASGDAWTLSGSKMYVLDGHIADLVLVAARTTNGVSLFHVAGDADGLTRTALATMDMTRKQARLDFDGVSATLIGAEGAGWPVLERVLDLAAVALAAEQVGGAQICLDTAVQYAKDRVQFGRPIGSFQAISHYLADGITAIDGARVLVHRAAWTRDEGRDVASLAPMAKLFATQTCRDVTGVAIQVHGGMGFTVECDAQLYFRRAKSWQLNWFDTDHLEDLIAAAVLD